MHLMVKNVKTQRAFWKGLYVLNWVLIGVFFLYGSWETFSVTPSGIFIALGRLMGLSATYMVLTQFFLMGRFPALERLWGLDGLSRFHQKNGRWSLVFLLIHPIALTIGVNDISNLGLLGQFKDFAYNYPGVYWAVIGMVLFLFVIVFSYSVVRLKLRYETWFAVHLLAYAAVFASFWHQFLSGTTLLANKLFYAYWVLLYIGVFGFHLVFRIIRPIYRSLHHNFVVDRVVRETPSTVSIYIRGNHLEHFGAHPGQFMIVRFLARELFLQSHPFSLSMMPSGNELRITVKELGDYTKKLSGLAAGTKVFIDGPHGIFTDLFSVSDKVLMIAGGIGITPIRSLMEEMLAKGKDVVLLYGNRNEDDVVFRKELEELVGKYVSRLILVMSDQENFAGEKGRIDQEKINRLVPDIQTREIYLCGPTPMMQGLITMFKSMGISEREVHYEKFAF